MARRREDVGELELPLLTGDLAQVGRADDVGHGEQGMVGVVEGFVLEDVDGRHAGPPRPEGLDRGARLEQSGPAGVHEQGGGAQQLIWD